MITIDLTDLESTIESEKSIKLNEAIKQIFKSKRSTIITGAGISCNAGIPDFRSSDGLYNLVKQKYPSKSITKGQDLFDISLFRDEISLALFCQFMESLYLSSLLAHPTETHKFIKTLKEKNKLLRCYTQNIDSIEKLLHLNVGIDLQDITEKHFTKGWKSLDVVQLHGNLHKLSCTQCYSSFDWNVKYQKQLGAGSNPQCNACLDKYQERLYLGKRLTGNIGMLRPDIVLYGEHHPQSELILQGLNLDLRLKPDLLLIMGTSLKVDGVKKLVKSLSHSIHQRGGKVIFVNKTPLAKATWDSHIDYEILSDCDDFVRILKRDIPDLFLTQEQLDSKKLKNNQKSADYIKLEPECLRIKSEGIKSESLAPEALTPPSTPSKKNLISQQSYIKLLKPSLNRKATKKLKFELPSPFASFTEDTESTVPSEASSPDTTVVKLEPEEPCYVIKKEETTSFESRKRSLELTCAFESKRRIRIHS